MFTFHELRLYKRSVCIKYLAQEQHSRHIKCVSLDTGGLSTLFILILQEYVELRRPPNGKWRLRARTYITTTLSLCSAPTLIALPRFQSYTAQLAECTSRLQIKPTTTDHAIYAFASSAKLSVSNAASNTPHTRSANNIRLWYLSDACLDCHTHKAAVKQVHAARNKIGGGLLRFSDVLNRRRSLDV